MPGKRQVAEEKMINLNDASVIKKIILKGKLVLKTPLLIGGGEADGFTDITMIKDKSGIPFIPGTSFIGVLRSMLKKDSKFHDYYFGDMEDDREKKINTQSFLVAGDIYLQNTKITVRDGVKIDRDRGVAENNAKYDYEAIESESDKEEAQGDFSIILTIRKRYEKNIADIEEFIDRIAALLEHGIFLGAHTSKGFGKAVGIQMRKEIYDFKNCSDVIAWLKKTGNPQKTEILQNLKYESPNDLFVLEADMFLSSSILVKTESDKTGIAAENLQKNNGDFIIPGATVKGVISQRIYDIFKNTGKEDSYLPKLLGSGKKNEALKSRLSVEEIYLQHNENNAPFIDYKQTRNRIDRFTGGTIDKALFTTRPVIQVEKDMPYFKLILKIKDCEDFEAGLMLFVLKDLWTGMVAFGGDKSIGRGILKGFNAKIHYKKSGKVMADAELTEDKDGKISISGMDGKAREILEKLAKTFADKDFAEQKEEAAK